MATTYVSDTKAGKSVSAWVILKKGKHVATVRAHYSDGGTCLVNVFDTYGVGFQRSTASGYGYDKLTAALSGLTIDGVRLVDNSNRADFEYNCNANGKPKGKRLPADVSGANWDKTTGDYSSWYIVPGLRRLEKLGYQVVQAI